MVPTRFLRKLAILAFVATTRHALAAPTFQGLPRLNSSLGSAAAISADGLTVVGSSGGEATRWRGGSPPLGLGILPQHFSSQARSVSGDGAVIVGDSGVGGGDRDQSLYSAFRWTSVDGMVELPMVLA